MYTTAHTPQVRARVANRDATSPGNGARTYVILAVITVAVATLLYLLGSVELVLSA
jgi:hypothetical protein